MENYLSGGSNTPIPYPPSYPAGISHGEGAYVYSTTGGRFLDLWSGYGALLFGHAAPEIKRVINQQIDSGWLFSNPNLYELPAALQIHQMVPCAETVRFATTGSEATMYAVRAARAYTGREKLIAIEGGYHGCNDSLMPCKGVPQALSRLVSYVPFNDLPEITAHINSGEYAAVIIEPVPANMGCILPESGYLAGIRDACHKTGTVLIFDEVISGFRIRKGGAQEYFQITPDLATFSKVIGSGLPISAVAGKKEIMEQYANGNAAFGGTFNGNPLSLAVVEYTLEQINATDLLKQLALVGDKIREALEAAISELRLKAVVSGIGPMFTIFFGVEEATNHEASRNSSVEQFAYFVDFLASQNVLFPPLPSETVFLSKAHLDLGEYIADVLCQGLRAVANRFQ